MNKAILLFSSLMLALSINHVYAQTTTFAVIGDFGTRNSNETSVATLVKSWNPDFVITLGDNIYNLSDYSEAVGKDYHEFMFPHDPVYGNASDPSENHFWPIVGNHDWDVSSLQNYLSYFTLPNNERYYTKKIGDIEFFAIDSDSRENDGTSSTSTQGLWIKDKIQNSTAKWKIVLFHHPAYSSSSGNSYMRWPFEDWGVDAVMSGHMHNYERILKDDNNDGTDLVYFVNGLGGASIKSFSGGYISGSQAHYDGDYGAMKVIESSSSLTFQFIDKNGTQRDYYVNDSPLPVELAFFTGALNGSDIELRWRTETEVNNLGFDIERSSTSLGTSWETIGFVEGHGNTNSPKQYNFIDTEIYQSGKYYYRLKQIDNDGTYEYSNIVSVEAGVPNNFYLSQNYPNPFNPETRIDFSLPEKQLVNIRVYNTLGELVAELINEVKEAGSYSLTFNASNLPSGVYFYRLQTPDFVENKKMTLLR